MVADGHLMDIPLESVYSSVVSLHGLRIITFLAKLNGPDLWATDIGNAYLEAFTMEQNYIVAGPEFGQLEGHYLIIIKALYGLRMSGLRWHECFADCLCNEGFSPCKAEPDIWMRLNGNCMNMWPRMLMTFVSECWTRNHSRILFRRSITLN
jgi:hypothetical protein